MRPFLAISLVVMTGCGDNLGEGDDFGTNSDIEAPVEDNGVLAKLVPEVCAASTWDSVVPTAKDVDLAVVQMQQGAAILTVPKQGGYLQGFLADARGLIIGDAIGTKIRTDGTWTGVSASVVDSRLIVGLTANDKTSINIVRGDLKDYRELAVVDGSVIGDAPILYSRGQRVTATGGPTGLVTSTFDEAWAPIGSEVVQRSVPMSMTSAAYGGDAAVAWSTDSECHLQRLAASSHSMQPFPCKNPRLAMNFAERAGELVYETGEGITISDILVNSHGEIANQILLTNNGKAPRIVFDGERYWVSYLNNHGDIVVGYLDEDHTLVAAQLEWTRPENGAYDLAVINGGVWVYSVDRNTGFGAHKLCLTR
ncbi:MAG: hypothetical protein SFX73_31620 [Kofleriaceae bacterium]|nr:hypothetical protein [Kofleriaceae bacterium]